jgi:hypothetical protein
MVILGLGSPASSATSRLQLALALVLAEHLGIKLSPETMELYDPVFTPVDRGVLSRRRLNSIDRAASDRYLAEPTDLPTFFFMPHCEAW